jgi:hypothetical protein
MLFWGSTVTIKLAIATQMTWKCYFLFSNLSLSKSQHSMQNMIQFLVGHPKLLGIWYELDEQVLISERGILHCPISLEYNYINGYCSWIAFADVYFLPVLHEEKKLRLYVRLFHSNTKINCSSKFLLQKILLNSFSIDKVSFGVQKC